MNEYILLMHDDVLEPAVADDEDRWSRYIGELRMSGQFDGGSSIGPGTVFNKNRDADSAPLSITGYLRIRAESIDSARKFLDGNPTFEAGGTVEIRELPRG